MYDKSRVHKSFMHSLFLTFLYAKLDYPSTGCRRGQFAGKYEFARRIKTNGIFHDAYQRRHDTFLTQSAISGNKNHLSGKIYDHTSDALFFTLIAYNLCWNIEESGSRFHNSRTTSHKILPLQR